MCSWMKKMEKFPPIWNEPPTDSHIESHIHKHNSIERHPTMYTQITHSYINMHMKPFKNALNGSFEDIVEILWTFYSTTEIFVAINEAFEMNFAAFDFRLRN